MATRDRPRTTREPLDETDVDRAIADDAADWEAMAQPFSASEPPVLRNDTGEELEWRMAAEREDERVAVGTPPTRPTFEPPATPPLEPDDPIRTLMSTPVAWVEPSVSLIELAATLETEAVGAVPVMSGDHLDGVVSERAIVRTLSRGGTPSDVWAADVMAGEPVYVDPDEPIITVAERMLDEGVRHLPVVSDGLVVGVVSVRDALRVLADAWRRARTSEEA